MKTKEKQINIYKVVNIDEETKEILMLDYLFDNGGGFKGATGTRFEPISEEQYHERISEDYIIDYIIDSGMIGEKINKDYERDFAYIIYEKMSEQEKKEVSFDFSYQEKWDELRKFGFSEDEYPVFNCIGGGRCFDDKFKGNKNPELSAKIREYEAKPKKKK